MASESFVDQSSIHQLFFQLSSDYLCGCGPEGILLEASVRWRSFFAGEPVVGRHLESFFHPQDRPLVHEKWTDLQPGISVSFTGRLQNARGEVINLEWSARHEAQWVGLAGRHPDDRAVLEELLDQSRHLLREAQIQAGMGHYVLDVAAGTWESSPTLDDIFGIGPGHTRDISGWLALVHPDHQEEMRTYLQENILVQREDFDKVYRIVRPTDQSERWVHCKGQLKLDSHGAPRQLFGSIRDVHREKTGTEALHLAEKNLKKANQELENRQRELADSEELFRNAFRTSPDAVNITTMEGLYVDVNEGFTKMTGYTREECLGKGAMELQIWQNPADRQTLVQQLGEWGECHNLEALFQNKNGTKTLGLMSAKIIYLKGVPHILSMTRDIGELRRTQEELARVQKLESLGLLAGGIAHDFNNLFAGIFGFIELSLLTLDQKHKAYQYLEKAKKAQSRSVELTRQLLIFAKGGSPVRKLLNLRPLLEEVVRPDEGRHSHQVIVEMEPRLWPIVADEGQLSQVLGNLLNNARQASPASAVIRLAARNAKVHETVDGKLFKGNFVRISIQDFGEGISAESLPKVFDPFFTTRNRGSGLGLSVCYSIVQKHEGFIRITSSLGLGTTVELGFPAVRNTAEEGERPTSDGLPTGRILLLDDEESIREVVGEYLRQMGFSVETAATGEAAVTLWKEAQNRGEPFLAGVFDLTLKTGLGGLDTSRAVLEADPGARIIVASGYSFDEALAQPEKFRLAGSLRKPFGPEELRNLLSRILN